MAAYLVARVTVTDPERYGDYLKVSPTVIEKYGGRFIARGGEIATLEGPEEERRVVLIEFPSLVRAKEFYDSPDYREARKLREGAGIAQIIVIEGVYVDAFRKYWNLLTIYEVFQSLCFCLAHACPPSGRPGTAE
jgi:uncharacterized protein (DUF1330 family)